MKKSKLSRNVTIFICADVPRLAQLQHVQSQTYVVLKKKMNIFEMFTKFFLVAIRHNKTNVVKEYSWAITEVTGWSCCGRSGVTVCIATELPCTYIQFNTHVLNSDLHKIQLVLERSSAT